MSNDKINETATAIEEENLPINDQDDEEEIVGLRIKVKLNAGPMATC